MTHPWNPGNGNPPCPPNNPHCGGTQPPNPGQNGLNQTVPIDQYIPFLLVLAVVIILIYKTKRLWGSRK